MTSQPPLDPRLNAYRVDLADVRLRGKVDVPRFVESVQAQVMRSSVPLKARPSGIAGLENEVLFGERVRVFDRADGWAWVQLERDNYVGYVPVETLTTEILPPTHRIQAVGTFLYPVADIKSPPLMHLSIGADIAVESVDDRFAKLKSGGYVVARHIAPLGRHARDFVAIAERFIGVPYLWGGRTRLGLDCSGLLQIALEAAGRPSPRDSDMQKAFLGSEILVPADLDGLQRGDLVFWKSHVGIMVDSLQLIHANAHHMAVAIEPLSAAADRTVKTGTPISAIKRL